MNIDIKIALLSPVKTVPASLGDQLLQAAVEGLLAPVIGRHRGQRQQLGIVLM